MLAANPALTVTQVKTMLRDTAQEWGATGQDPDYGWGRLDSWAAVKRAGNFPGGTAPTVPMHQTFTGRITTAGGVAEHTVNIADTAYPLAVTLIMPDWSGSNTPDFDLYVLNPDGTELGHSTGTSRQELVAQPVTRTGAYKISVRAYAGSGDYIVDVSAGLGAPPPPVDQPPTVAIDQPAEGATVSGTVPVKVRAADDVRVARAEVSVDGGAYSDITASYDGTYYTYQWNTAAVPNGAHTLTARATDSAAHQATATRHVTVSNSAPPPPPPPPSDQYELIRTGRVTAGARDANVSITVRERGYVDLTLGWAGSADLDFYVYAPDGTLIGRAYTINNPEQFQIDTARYGTGTYRVRVNLYSGADSNFSLSARGFQVETYTGAVSPASRDSVKSRALAYSGRGRAVLSWTGSSDLDFFVYDPSGRERARAYTVSNPEQADIPFDTNGIWTVRVNLYSGAGVTYTLRLYVPEAILS